jgi:hypothetical protein
VAEGDKVVSRFRARGTHQGETEDLGPPTGNRIEITSISMSAVIEGKIVEAWTRLRRHEHDAPTRDGPRTAAGRKLATEASLTSPASPLAWCAPPGSSRSSIRFWPWRAVASPGFRVTAARSPILSTPSTSPRPASRSSPSVIASPFRLEDPTSLPAKRSYGWPSKGRQGAPHPSRPPLRAASLGRPGAGSAHPPWGSLGVWHLRVHQRVHSPCPRPLSAVAVFRRTGSRGGMT